jgi:general secretion pathway protein E
LHTNTAVGAITRLRDMGIEPFLISSSLLGVLAQRLVRTLCPSCKQSYQADAAQKALFDLDEYASLTLYKPAGCGKCNHKGYRGRTGIYELLMVNEQVQELIHNEAGEQAMEKVVRQHTPSIRSDGLERVRQGVTSLEEVMRVTKEG